MFFELDAEFERHVFVGAKGGGKEGGEEGGAGDDPEAASAEPQHKTRRRRDKGLDVRVH